MKNRKLTNKIACRNQQPIAADCNGLQPIANDVATGSTVSKSYAYIRSHMTEPTPAETLPEIDGIEQLDTPPAGSRPFTKTYYRDKADELITEVTSLPVREVHCICPRKGWPKRIYRKPATEATK